MLKNLTMKSTFSSLEFHIFFNTQHFMRSPKIFLSYNGHFCFKYMLCRLKLILDTKTLGTIEILHE